MNILKIMLDIEFDRQMRENKNAYKTFFKKIPNLCSFLILMQGLFFLIAVGCFAGIESPIPEILAFIVHGGIAICLYIYSKIALKEFEKERTEKAKQSYEQAKMLWMQTGLDIRSFYRLFPDYTSAFIPTFSLDALRMYQKYKLEREAQNRGRYNRGSQDSNSSYSKRTNITSSRLQKAFELFGITNSKKLSKDELKSKYRQLAKSVHPDVKGGSKEEFNKVMAAYEELRTFYGYQ